MYKRYGNGGDGFWTGEEKNLCLSPHEMILRWEKSNRIAIHCRQVTAPGDDEVE